MKPNPLSSNLRSSTTEAMRVAGVLSVVIPVYNEEATLAQIAERVRAIDLRTEIIAVDDGSTDRSREILAELESEGLIDRVILHDVNRGKGAALKTGFSHATGDWVAVQDADLEYNPQELPNLVDPIYRGKADVVFGSRFLGGAPHRVLFFWHSIANRCLTLLSNMFTDLNLTDMETCYKVFRREVIQQIDLRERRFGVEPEITAKVAKLKGVRVYEVGISYEGRSYEEGKKIGWKDGVSALRCILRYNLFCRRSPMPTASPSAAGIAKPGAQSGATSTGDASPSGESAAGEKKPGERADAHERAALGSRSKAPTT